MTTVLSENLPAGMKKRQELAHLIADQCFIKVWNVAVVEVNKLNESISGNDALAYFGTLIADFTARWIVEMDKIAQSDDAGIDREELVKTTLNAVIEMLGGKAIYEEDNPLPGGIKRIKKSNNLNEE